MNWTDLPGVTGSSERNLKYMIRFYTEYGAAPIVQQAAALSVAQSGPGPSDAVVPQAVAQLGADDQNAPKAVARR